MYPSSMNRGGESSPEQGRYTQAALDQVSQELYQSIRETFLEQSPKGGLLSRWKKSGEYHLTISFNELRLGRIALQCVVTANEKEVALFNETYTDLASITQQLDVIRKEVVDEIWTHPSAH